jgi:hypothetical protein
MAWYVSPEIANLLLLRGPDLESNPRLKRTADHQLHNINSRDQVSRSFNSFRAYHGQYNECEDAFTREFLAGREYL